MHCTSYSPWHTASHHTERATAVSRLFFCHDDYIAYIDLMAKLCTKYHVETWPWCLMPNHVHLVKFEPLLSMVANWKDFLSLSSEEEMNTFRKHERFGRPLAQEAFIDNIEALLVRNLRPQKPGPKRKLAFSRPEFPDRN